MIIFAQLVITITSLVAIFYYFNKKILALETLIKTQKEIQTSQNVGEILMDLQNSGYSVIRIDPDSILVRNRLRR